MPPKIIYKDVTVHSKVEIDCNSGLLAFGSNYALDDGKGRSKCEVVSNSFFLGAVSSSTLSGTVSFDRFFFLKWLQGLFVLTRCKPIQNIFFWSLDFKQGSVQPLGVFFSIPLTYPPTEILPSLKLTAKARKKMDGWKYYFPIGSNGLFSGGYLANC